MQDLAKKIPVIRDCLQWANDVGLILKASEKRKVMFKKHCKETKKLNTGSPRPLCPTRWSVRVTSVWGILNTYQETLNILEDIAYSRGDYGSKANAWSARTTLERRNLFWPSDLKRSV